MFTHRQGPWSDFLSTFGLPIRIQCSDPPFRWVPKRGGERLCLSTLQNSNQHFPRFNPQDYQPALANEQLTPSLCMESLELIIKHPTKLILTNSTRILDSLKPDRITQETLSSPIPSHFLYSNNVTLPHFPLVSDFTTCSLSLVCDSFLGFAST